MKVILCLSLLISTPGIFGHAGHDGPASGETIQQYAQRHMSSEHHIDSFDTRSFHQLHDLNRDGYWDREEIEAVYGVHHHYSRKKFKDAEELKKKAEFIVTNVLDRVDLNKDGKISAAELEIVGLDGLPNFEGAEGHHYDVESEFFLHHEEEHHSSPETQTDESYNHPEDADHFSQHEAIEREEAEREAKFQGISVEEVLKYHGNPAVPKEGGQPSVESAPIPKVTRVAPPEKQDPSVRFKTAAEEGKEKGEWGKGKEGFKAPVDAGGRMRKGVPYKYKFRRNWGDF